MPTPAEILQQFLSRGRPTMGANDPLELASLRDQQAQEMAHNLEVQKTSKIPYATGATESDLASLRSDITQDPFTGAEPQARVKKQQEAADLVQQFLDPQATKMREQQEAQKIRESSAPIRAAHETDIPVAHIRAEADVEAAKNTPRGSGYAEPLVQVLDPDTGMAMWKPRSEASGGMATTGVERDRIKGLSSLKGLVDLVEKYGTKSGWKGIGLTGPVESFLYKNTGAGNPNEEAFRDALSKLQSEASFGEGGKNLTAVEKDMISRFTADIATNPTAARTRLKAFRDMIDQKMGVYNPAGRSTPPAPTGGTVKLLAPDGSIADVPADQVQHFLSLGAKRVGAQ